MNATSRTRVEGLTLGLVGGPAPAGLIPTLCSIRRWCLVVVVTADVADRCGAVLVTNPGPLQATIGSRPLAVWVDSADGVPRPEESHARLVVSDVAEVVTRAGDRGLFAPKGPEPVAAVPVLPFLRARIRGARGLPSPMIVEHGADGWSVGPNRLHVDGVRALTAVSCASAAIVTGPELLVAMAWATPCVTDDISAQSVGAQPGRDVLVAATLSQRRRVAVELAADADLAAAVAWRGRRLIETRHSPDWAAATLVRRLGLGSAFEIALPSSLAGRLSELGADAGSTIAARAGAATLLLAGGA